jgi:hypothetical protein
VPGLALLPAQSPTQSVYNVREVPPVSNVQDKPGIHTLYFRFKNPRTITVDVPGKGRKVVWYMWYQVYNRPPEGAPLEPYTFQPDFELVPIGEGQPRMVFHDQILPAVQEAIRKQEGDRELINSVSIGAKAIPPTPPDSAPRTVTGVAIWPDVEEKVPGMTRFSVFISGLSDGWALAATQDNKQLILRKTLQLNFRRLTDVRRTEAQDIQFVDPPHWIYRNNFAEPIEITQTQASPNQPKAP